MPNRSLVSPSLLQLKVERNIDMPPNLASYLNDVPAIQSRSMGQFIRRIPLGFYGLVVGVLGLGLAVIPSIAMQRPLPNPFETPEQAQRRMQGPPSKKGGITLNFKGLSMNFGGKEVEKPTTPNPSLTNDPIRWFMIAAILCGLAGLLLCSVAHVKEKQTAITLTGIGCSIAAITWQFLVIGIILGVAVVVVLLILRVGFDSCFRTLVMTKRLSCPPLVMHPMFHFRLMPLFQEGIRIP